LKFPSEFGFFEELLLDGLHPHPGQWTRHPRRTR
jgi:hypothetical protein